MRADISAPLCDSSLPSGFPAIPGGNDGTSPCIPRRRKQGSHRIRHLGSPGRAPPPTRQGEADGQVFPQHEDHRQIYQEHPGYAPVPVTDPQSLQEKRELLEYFQKLRVLVPSLPKTGKIPNLDVIEHVINYIKQLERQLVGHPMIQVLENSAYISGLLQSMAPEFDISHLFPTHHQHHQTNTTNGSTMSAENNSNSNNNNTSSHLNFNTASAQQMLRQNLLRYSTELSSQGIQSPSNLTTSSPKLKTRKSSVRKPLTLLSSTNSTI